MPVPNTVPEFVKVLLEVPVMSIPVLPLIVPVFVTLLVGVPVTVRPVEVCLR